MNEYNEFQKCRCGHAESEHEWKKTVHMMHSQYSRTHLLKMGLGQNLD